MRISNYFNGLIKLPHRYNFIGNFLWVSFIVNNLYTSFHQTFSYYFFFLLSDHARDIYITFVIIIYYWHLKIRCLSKLLACPLETLTKICIAFWSLFEFHRIACICSFYVLFSGWVVLFVSFRFSFSKKGHLSIKLRIKVFWHFKYHSLMILIVTSYNMLSQVSTISIISHLYEFFEFHLGFRHLLHLQLLPITHCHGSRSFLPLCDWKRLICRFCKLVMGHPVRCLCPHRLSFPAWLCSCRTNHSMLDSHVKALELCLLW